MSRSRPNRLGRICASNDWGRLRGRAWHPSPPPLLASRRLRMAHIQPIPSCIPIHLNPSPTRSNRHQHRPTAATAQTVKDAAVTTGSEGCVCARACVLNSWASWEGGYPLLVGIGLGRPAPSRITWGQMKPTSASSEAGGLTNSTRSQTYSFHLFPPHPTPHHTTPVQCRSPRRRAAAGSTRRA